MQRLTLAAFLAALCLTPLASQAQDRTTARAERKIAVILTEFDGELRGYERELKYFQRTAEFKPLLELRDRLVTQAGEMARLDTAGRGSGPAVLELAREMDRTARKLDADTRVLEERADAVGGAEGRNVAGRMKTHANLMVRATDELIAMFR